MGYVNTDVILGAKPIEFPDQTNLLIKGLQAQGLMGQNRLLQIQGDTAQAAYDATQDINAQIKAHPEWANDPNAMRQGIWNTGGTYGAPMLKQLADAQIAQTKLQQAQESIDANHMSRIASDVGAAAANGPDAVAGAISNAKYLPADRKQDMFTHLSMVAGDKPSFDSWVRQVQNAGLTAEQQIGRNDPSILPTDNGFVAVNKDGSNPRYLATQQPGAPSSAPITINQSYVGAQPAGNFAGDPTKIYASIQSIADPVQRAQALRALQNQLAGANPTPDASGVFQGTGATSPVTIGATGAPAPSGPPQVIGAKRQEFDYRVDPVTQQTIAVPKYGAPGATTPDPGSSAVIQVPGSNGGIASQDQGLIDKIGHYDLPPFNSAARNPRQIAIMNAVSDQYPDFDATRYDAKKRAAIAFTSGPQGNTLRSLGVASDHLDQLGQLADGLNNGDLPLVNRVSNYIAQQTGQAAPTTVDAVRSLVADEVAKAVVGGATALGDRSDLKAKLDGTSLSPLQLKSVIQSYRGMMQAQREGLFSQAEAAGLPNIRQLFGAKQIQANPGSGAGWSIEKVN